MQLRFRTLSAKKSSPRSTQCQRKSWGKFESSPMSIIVKEDCITQNKVTCRAGGNNLTSVTSAKGLIRNSRIFIKIIWSRQRNCGKNSSLTRKEKSRKIIWKAQPFWIRYFRFPHILFTNPLLLSAESFITNSLVIFVFSLRHRCVQACLHDVCVRYESEERKNGLPAKQNKVFKLQCDTEWR